MKRPVYEYSDQRGGVKKLLYLGWGQRGQISVNTKDLLCRICNHCGPGSVVGIATGYGLDGPGIESRWGRDFSHLSRPALGPTHPSLQGVPGLSRG
jgi:hypothetical protein